MNKIRSFPIFLIIVGIIFLIQNLGWMQNAWFKLWPTILIIIGLIDMYNSVELKKN